jgi:hypothetical protein
MTKKIHNRGRILTLDATGLQLQPSSHALKPVKFASTLRDLLKLSALHLCLSLCLLSAAFAGVGGSISGTITDQSGAAIAKASVTLINSSTGVRQSTTSDGRGAYTFPVLPVGSYVLEVSQPGFEPYRRSGIVLDTSTALLLDVVLQVGETTVAVTVSDSAVHL